MHPAGAPTSTHGNSEKDPEHQQDERNGEKYLTTSTAQVPLLQQVVLAHEQACLAAAAHDDSAAVQLFCPALSHTGVRISGVFVGISTLSKRAACYGSNQTN